MNSIFFKLKSNIFISSKLKNKVIKKWDNLPKENKIQAMDIINNLYEKQACMFEEASNIDPSFLDKVKNYVYLKLNINRKNNENKSEINEKNKEENLLKLLETV